MRDMLVIYFSLLLIMYIIEKFPRDLGHWFEVGTLGESKMSKMNMWPEAKLHCDFGWFGYSLFVL